MPSGQCTIYDELLLPLIIQGYLVIIELEMQFQHQPTLKHLSELMADVEIYGWEPV